VFFMRITDEDTWMEYGQVLLLVLGSLAGGWLARSLWKDRRRAWALGYLVLTLALFWAAGEEISWGQRLLHLRTPAWFEAHNVQQEINLHNLGNTDGRLGSFTDRALSWIVFASAALWMTGLHAVAAAPVAHPGSLLRGQLLESDPPLHAAPSGGAGNRPRRAAAPGTQGDDPPFQRPGVPPDHPLQPAHRQDGR
jgi:hypothetical protein